MSLLHLLSYGIIIAAFAFTTLSLANGLLFISDLMEEHSKLSKMIGKRGIYVIITLHAIFYFTESLPFHRVLFSIFCHFVYLQNFSASWPLILLSSPSFIGSCILVIVNHFLWFFYFSRVTQEARHRSYRGDMIMTTVPNFADIATFFATCVWLAPLFLFLSLSANDHALPTSGLTRRSSNAAATQPQASLFKTIYDWLPFKSLPRMRSKKYKLEDEGLISPQSTKPFRAIFSPAEKNPSPPSTPEPTGTMGTPRLQDEPDNIPPGSRLEAPRLTSARNQRMSQMDGVQLGWRKSAGTLPPPGQ